jgi:hypothetical protein
MTPIKNTSNNLEASNRENLTLWRHVAGLTTGGSAADIEWVAESSGLTEHFAPRGRLPDIGDHVMPETRGRLRGFDHLGLRRM